MNERCVYLSGQFVSEDEARIPIRDSGWLFGETLTTTLRTFAHEPFRVKDHLTRLIKSCKAAQLDFDISETELGDVIFELVRRNRPLLAENGDYRVDVDITPGLVDMENNLLSDSGPTVVMYCTPLAFASWAEAYIKGCPLATATSRWIPAACLDPKVKHRSRLLYRIAKREAELIDPDAYFPLMLSIEGDVAETTGSNFFIVTGGQLVTAPTTHVLAGISRTTTMEAAAKLGIEVEEKSFQLFDVYNADEAFVTSTPFVLLPVTRVNHTAIGDGCPGPITDRILKQWNEVAGIDIAAQALGHVDEKVRESLVISN